MNLIVKFFSMKVSVVLMLIFGLACAVATFIENDFGADSARDIVYASLWFALIQVWLGICIINNILKYKIYTKNKLPSFIFHVSFLFILLGSGLTRNFGIEGSVHIREGQTQDIVTTLEPFVEMKAYKDGKVYSVSKKKLFSFYGKNSFDINLDIEGKEAIFAFKKLVPNAVKKIASDINGKPMVSLMISDGSKPTEVVLNKGDEVGNSTLKIDFSNKDNNLTTPYFHIFLDGGKFYFLSNQKVSWYKMSDSSKGDYAPDTKTPFISKQLYTINGINIVPKEILKSGKLKWSAGTGRKNSSYTAMIGDVSYDGKTEEVALLGFGRGSEGRPKMLEIGGVNFVLKWGSKTFQLPFKLQLVDFQLDRYPGSMSPSSYASEIKVIDNKNGVNMPYRIYMNHVLDYGGFRFFQSSYDRDELGTILSVNRDPGKWPTYMGYFLLSLGLILNMLNPKSRFRKLASDINANVASKTLSFLAFALFFTNTNLHATTDVIENSHAQLFGTILVQSTDGRIKPVDSIAHDVLNKVYRKTSFKGQSADQVFLGMVTMPQIWQNRPMIYVYDKVLKNIIGVKENQKYATFNDFFNPDGKREYKLLKYVEQANRKRPSDRDKFDKDVLKVDERLNVCYYVYTGEILKIFPKIGDKNNKWYGTNSAIMSFPKSQSEEIKNILTSYFDAVSKGLSTGNYSDADKSAKKIKAYQVQYASEIIPSQSKIDTEIKFNRYKIFQRLTPVYLLTGFALLFAIFLKMLAPNMSINLFNKIIFALIALAFAVHTVGLGMRWYISGHAPWSDGYESMVYIAWALALAGLMFSKKSPISLALTAILAGISLFVAHLSWMDPQITNLVPVLKSYWLTIHVSVITASYGFLGLCALLGFFTLILFIIRNPKRNDSRNKEISRNIIEATKINEMSMILGLSLLTIGNFLGGVWANESWGRYWGWDAKETWALISILVYAAVAHMRFIPKLNNQYAFAVASTFAFWSIIMTYFGVNFYLSGMHSYASGDPVPIPTFVPVIALTMFVVSILAFTKRDAASKL